MSQSPNQYELLYFDGRGLAEVARFLFAYSCTPFTDTRITREQWNATNDASAFNKTKAPFGKLPLLRVKTQSTGGETHVVVELPQSRTIERYLAKQFGLYGGNDEQAALIDAFIDHCFDVSTAFFQAKGDDENKLVFETQLPTHYANMSNFILQHSKTGHVVGDSITWADIALFAFVNFCTLTSMNPWFNKAATKLKEEYPVLAHAVKRVKTNEKIAAYMAAHKAMPW